MIEETKKFALIYVFIAVCCIFIIIFALGYCSDNNVSKKQQTVELKKMDDSIKVVHSKVDSLNVKIRQNDSTTSSISKHIQRVTNNEKEINNIIDSNSIDRNIKFLSDFLSKEDKAGKCYSCCYYSTSTSPDK